MKIISKPKKCVACKIRPASKRLGRSWVCDSCYRDYQESHKND